MKKILLAGVCVVLGGCQSMGEFADSVGSYMPVLSDERCEHWQCFTDEGKAQSDYNKMMKQQQQQAPKNGAAPAAPPPPSSYSDPEMDPWNNYKP